MPKQLNVSLAFTADTSQAKKQLQDLQQQLNNLTTRSSSNSNAFGLTKEIEQATVAASKLQVQLAEATNPQTGMLDLGKFTESMKRSGMDLEKYKDQLIQLGPEGKQAFLSLADSISNAEVPLLRANSLLKQMGTTIANAARWQISSSIIHGFMGAVQSAYGYAQDLNASLNSIRIVSGQTTEQMARFADQANKAAQALSTSTLAYTDASLIFYQQGLTGDAVTERVDTVLKLSNVTGDSAEQVSSYMTAIWNNFYDGSQSLESFADKITALGAATASSSAEIAAGLQQFAAIGNTVGLSYDYAATALATIVAQTRQSESTVGNGLRTIFARLSSLKQGGTDEDGVDLTKYTKALQEVGVNVLDQNGNLKEMDQILEDIGSKWGSLNKQQQVALAQTVGGVRQYATLIALFDNWDQFQRNLDVTRNADGTLQEQANIYAESWEAAQKRVKTAWQAIYQDLIKDKFFITILNGIEGILKGVDSLIDSAGGLSGVLSGLVLVITKAFGDSVVASIEKIGTRLRSLTKSGRQAIENQRLTALNLAKEIRFDSSTDEGIASNAVYQEINGTQQLLIQNAAKLNEEETKYYQNALNILKVSGQQVIAEGKKLDLVKQQAEKVSFNAQRKMGADNWRANQGAYSTFTSDSRSFGAEKEIYDEIEKAVELGTSIDEIKKKWQSLKDDKSFDVLTEDAEKRINDLIKRLEALKNENGDLKKGIEEASALASNIQVGKEGQAATDLGLEAKDIQEIADASIEVGKQTTLASNSIRNFKDKVQVFKGALSNIGPTVSKVAQSITTAAQSIAQLTFVISNASNIIETWNDKSLSTGDKLKSIIPSFAMMLSALAAMPLPLQIIAAVLGVIAIALKKIYDLTPLKKFNDAKKAVENMTSAVNEAKNAAAEATDAYAKLTNVLDGLDDKEKAIRRLAEGTEEWSKAISESNTQLIQTLETAGLLNDAELIYNKNGLITVKNAEQLKQSALEASKIADLNVLVSQAALKDAQRQSSIQGLSSNLFKQNLLDMGKDFFALMGRSFAGLSVEDYQRKSFDFNDQEHNYSDAALIEGYAQQLVENGLAGVHINEQMARDLAAQNPELEFLEDIADRQDILDGISEVAAAIQGSEIGGKAYKVEAARNAAEMAGFEIPDLPESQLDDFYLNLYDKLIGQLLESHGIANISDLDIGKNSDYRQAAYQAYADQSSGRYSYDTIGDTLVNNETDQNVSDVNEQLIKVAYFTSLLSDSFADLHVSTDTLKDKENAWSQEIDARKRASIEQAQTNLSGSDLFNKTGANVNGFISQHGSSVELEFLMTGDVDEFKTLPELEEYLRKLTQEEHHVTVNVNADDLTHFKGDTEDLRQEFETLSQFLQDNWDDYEELSDHLEDCSAEADALAWAMMRFDDAMQDVADNYDDWKEALNSKDIKAINAAVQDLKKTYGNLLDIDGSQLSDDFLKDADNLELLNQILYGTEEQAVAAYNKLQDLANEEILIKFGVDPASADDTVNYINQLKDDIGYDDIQIGASLDDTNLMAGLEAMINALAGSATEAEELLQGFGFDADVEEQEVSEPEAREIIDLMPQVVPNAQHMQIPTVAQDGSMDYQSMDIPGLKYTGDKHEEGGESTKTFTALKIQSLHKSAGGNFKIHNSPARTGARNNASKGKSGGGGGGSKGSQPKKKTVKEHKEQKKEEDRYHDLKERIEDVNTALKRLGTTKDRVYGKSKLKYMDQELSKMKEQIGLTKEYIKEAERYLKIDRAALEGIKKGAAFDENGMLTNYEEVLQNITTAYNNSLAEYNNAVDRFNASAQEEGDNAALDAAEKALTKAEKTFNENKKILKQYEDTYNLIQEKQELLQDQLNEYYDTLLENVVIKVNIELEMDEGDLDLLKWIYKYLGDSADAGADKIANIAKQIELVNHELEVTKEGLAEIFSNHGRMSVDMNNLDHVQMVRELREFMSEEGLRSELTQAEADQIRKYIKDLTQYYDTIYDGMVQANEVVREAIDEWNDRLNDQLETYNKLNKVIDHYNKIIELTGRKQLKLSSQQMKALDRSQINNDMNQMSSLQTILEEQSRELLEAQRQYQQALASGDQDTIKQTKETLDKLQSVYEDYQDRYRQMWQQTQEDINKAADNSLKLMVEDAKQSLGDLDVLRERYANRQKADHLFLEDYEKYHELNKTMKDLNKSLAATNNTLIRGKLLDLQDEINADMQTGVKISDTQAEIYARRVALLQAEAELLDAQNSKSAVRMTRDNEGNFSYTYTADQDQIGEAEQNYGDKFYELMKYEKDSIEEKNADYLETQAEFLDRLTELNEQWRNGDISSYEEYQRLMQELMDEFQEYWDYYGYELGMLYDEQARLRDDDWLDFENILNSKLAEYGNFVDEFEDSIEGRIQPGYQTLDEEQQIWAEVMQEGYETTLQVAKTWQEDTAALLQQAGVSADTFATTMLTDLQNVDNQSDTTKEHIEDMVDLMAEKMDAVMDAADEMNSNWQENQANMRQEILETCEELNAMLRLLNQTQDEERETQRESAITKTALDVSAQTAESSIGAFEAAADAARDLAAAARDAMAALQGLGDPGGRPTRTITGVVDDPNGAMDTVGLYYTDSSGNSGYTIVHGNSTAYRVGGHFATGGYTGAWGPEGRLAVLHEKELVLNKDDTENMLTMVGMVRSIVDTIGTNGMLNTLALAAGGASGLGNFGNSLEQQVHIEANFPNVQSHTEIEMAINNLINSASQYVNRKS